MAYSSFDSLSFVLYTITLFLLGVRVRSRHLSSTYNLPSKHSVEKKVFVMTSLAMVADSTESTKSTESTESTEPEKELAVGPEPPPPPKKPLAFLPNLMPTYKTDNLYEEDGIHMFSLVHQTPHVEQGWRPMCRGLHLKMLLVDRTTLHILERLGAVDWVPLPGGLDAGAAGIFCYTPDKNAAKLIRDGVAESEVPKTVAAKMEESLMALETMSLQDDHGEDCD